VPPTSHEIAGIPFFSFERAFENEDIDPNGPGAQDAEAEWIVMINEGVTNAQVELMCSASKNGCKQRGDVELGVPFIELRGSLTDLSSTIQSVPGAAQFVEPDLQAAAGPTVASTRRAATWGLKRIGVDKTSRSGTGVTIFVLDTGVRVSHSEFEQNGISRASAVLDMSSGQRVECSGVVGSVCGLDNQGHGTHCAGSAAGKTYGVAPGAEVRAMKVLNDQGGGQFSWSYSALDWLATSSIRPAVASMSLGGAGTLQAFRQAVDGAVKAGVTVVVAAGNNNADACSFSPAFVPNAITVGSITSLDVRSGFSNFGSCVDIWGPGSDVVSAGHTSDSGTAKMSGTSMACPHVSGAAALILQSSPGLAHDKVLELLLANAGVNSIASLSATDTNSLLYVGDDGPPPAADAPPGTDPALDPCDQGTSTGPDGQGDCTCRSGRTCREPGLFGMGDCTYSQSARFLGLIKSSRWYASSCSNCRCLTAAEAAAPPVGSHLFVAATLLVLTLRM